MPVREATRTHLNELGKVLLLLLHLHLGLVNDIGHVAVVNRLRLLGRLLRRVHRAPPREARRRERLVRQEVQHGAHGVAVGLVVLAPSP